jgi:hypothetical protein
MSVSKVLGSLAFSTALVAFTACSTNLLDLGTNVDGDGGAGLLSSDGAIAVARASCTEWSDDDVQSAQAGECPGSCTESPGGELAAFPTMKQFIDQTGGPWLSCRGSVFGPSDTIGVEFAPGCRLFFLKRDSTGALTRGSEIRHQGVYGIFVPATDKFARRIDLKLSDGSRTTYEVKLQLCPKTLVLTRTDSLPGRAVEIIRLTPAREEDGGPPGTFPGTFAR